MAYERKEWSGSLCPIDPDNCWIDDKTGEHVNASTSERSKEHRDKKSAPQPTADQLTALARYAKANGRTWKTKLADAWLDGRDAREPDGCYLRQVRNTFGPSWLKAYRLPE